MKALSLSFILVLLSSYVYGFIINDESVEKSPPRYEVKENILVQVARTYDPNESDNFEFILNYGSFFAIPDSIEVSEGSSGDGWFSLIVGERKFCYQGNRYSSEDTFGDKFLLKGELVNLSDKCYSKVFENFKDEVVYSEYGDVVVAKIEGGGCDYCESTIVEFELEAIEEEEVL
jgi:hypothetical protein